MSILLPIIAFVVVLAVIMVVMSRFNNPKNASTRLREFQATMAQSQVLNQDDEIALGLEQRKSVFAEMIEPLITLTGGNPEKTKQEMGMRFAQAGINSPSAINYFLLAQRLCPILGILVAVMIYKTIPDLYAEAGYLLEIIIVYLGFKGPDIFLRIKKDRRSEALTFSFPDALDLVLVCVESGLALDAALARVCRELGRAHPEITKELNRTRLELSILNDRPRALTNLAERTDILPFRALVAALLQSERFGTSLTDTLRVLSEDYRNTRLMLAEQKAGRLPALITVVLMPTLMPAMVIILLGPGIIAVMKIWDK